jgi:hypothetical protein
MVMTTKLNNDKTKCFDFVNLYSPTLGTLHYKIFIEFFSNIVHPITSFQNKGLKIKWNYECKETFYHSNNILTSSPIMNIFYLNEYFIVCIDAYKEGLEGVLKKNVHVICYDSRKLK